MIVELSRSTFLSKLADAQSGQWIMYHVGFLYSNRIKNRRLNALATEVYALSTAKGMAGEVELVQRRLGDMMYEYYAVKR